MSFCTSYNVIMTSRHFSLWQNFQDSQHFFKCIWFFQVWDQISPNLVQPKLHVRLFKRTKQVSYSWKNDKLLHNDYFNILLSLVSCAPSVFDRPWRDIPWRWVCLHFLHYGSWNCDNNLLKWKQILNWKKKTAKHLFFKKLNWNSKKNHIEKVPKVRFFSSFFFSPFFFNFFRDQAHKSRTPLARLEKSLPGGDGPYCYYTVCSLFWRVFEPKFDPLNTLKNSPKLAHTSRLVTNLIKCKK